MRSGASPFSPEIIRHALEQRTGKACQDRILMERSQKSACVRSHSANWPGWNFFDATMLLDQVVSAVITVRNK
jgi:hypothetical protein